RDRPDGVHLEGGMIRPRGTPSNAQPTTGESCVQRNRLLPDLSLVPDNPYGEPLQQWRGR
ncbi:MAG: hypothetical protein ACOVNV_07840, partial [Pirellulaceae bacterium]